MEASVATMNSTWWPPSSPAEAVAAATDPWPDGWWSAVEEGAIHPLWSEPVQLAAAYLMVLALLAAYHRTVVAGHPWAWFELHAVANAAVALFSLPAVLQWLSDPLSVVAIGSEGPPPPVLGPSWDTAAVLLHTNNQWPTVVALAVHTYHCLAFPLSKQDLFHHALFVPTIGSSSLCAEWGCVRNCLTFFITGLPGGVDYFFLVLTKRGLMSKLYQKRMCSKINLWCRGPAVGVLIPATCYAAWLYSRLEDGAWFRVAAIAGLSWFNGLHYMEMAIKNYQMHLSKRLLNLKSNTQKQAADAVYWTRKEVATRRLPSAQPRHKSLG